MDVYVVSEIFFPANRLVSAEKISRQYALIDVYDGNSVRSASATPHPGIYTTRHARQLNGPSKALLAVMQTDDDDSKPSFSTRSTRCWRPWPV